MEFIILESLKPGQYGGTERSSPSYVEVVNPNDQVNMLWDWYVNKTGNGGTLDEHDLPKARELILEFEKYGKRFQIFEAARNADDLKMGQFIGYDISLHGLYLSVLSDHLKYHDENTKSYAKYSTKPAELLIERYFQPQLNEYGLFTSREATLFLREVLLELIPLGVVRGEPNIDEYELVALGVVN